MRAIVFVFMLASCSKIPAAEEPKPECDLLLNRSGFDGSESDDVDVCDIDGKTYVCTADRCYQIGCGR